MRFLRHVERCRLLLHLVDVVDTTRDAVAGIEALELELARYRPELAAKPRLLVLTKADAVQDRTAVDAVVRHAERCGRSCQLISAVTGQGLKSLIREVGNALDRQRSAGG